MKLSIAILIALMIIPLLAQGPDVFEQHVGGVPAMDSIEIEDDSAIRATSYSFEKPEHYH